VGGQVSLGRLFGIPIVAGISWFLWLFLMVFLLSGYFGPLDGGPPDGRAFGLSLIVVVVYVVALLGHEFGHALMGRRLGIETEGVELWMLGGLAHLSRPSRTPREEFLVAAAGPAVTFVAAAIAAAVVGSQEGWSLAAVWEVGSRQYAGSTTVSQVAGLILFVEAIALLFNLLPALPLDGGRIARAAVWRITGSPLKGTAFTAQAGKALGIGIGLFGAYLYIRGGSLYTAFWAFFLAWFIWQNASAAVIPTERRRRGPSLIATGTVMNREPVWVAADDTAAEAQEQTFGPHGVDWAVVLGADGRLRGILHGTRVREELDAGRPDTPAAALLPRGRTPSTSDDVRLDRLMKDKELERLGALPVLDGRGVLVGVVSREAARQALVVEGGLRG
jgi:Zn-dependent protease